MFDTPIVFLVFNRPDTTARVFDAIRNVRPNRLFVVADGPRNDRPDEAGQCQRVRTIAQDVDWPCDLQTHFSSTNLGCGRCVSSGIDWAFESCESAIILEDDCLPHVDFFHFCGELLRRYGQDPRVAHIGGNSFHGDSIAYPGSYYFTRFPHVWGWATWRRAWKHYDFQMRDWPTRRDSGMLEQLFGDPIERSFWTQSFDRVHGGRVDTWDTQWSYCLLRQNALAINPASNLVSNIGFGPDATHTHRSSWLSDLPTAELGEWRHPEMVIEHRTADRRTFDVVFDGNRLRRAAATR